MRATRFFLILNIIWTISALIYDFPVITTIPLWAWPFVIICPLFPALLALTWYFRLGNRSISSYLLAFAVIPSAVYGILALFFYPVFILYDGFSFPAIGQLFWVWVYAAQAFYFLFTTKTKPAPLLTATTFLIISLLIHHQTLGFGYVSLAILPESTRLFLLIIGMATTLVLSGLWYLRSLRQKVIE